MMLRKWEDMPQFMKCKEVKYYYDILKKKRMELLIKRIFDLVVSFILLMILAIPMGIIALLIKLDSPGPIFFRQERITAYVRKFKIHKFRTMVNNADKIGAAVTTSGDARITKIGSKLRDLRLDEIPQLIDVLNGDMSFVGTRPEVTKYVKKYTKEMRATLLLPAGITSEASIKYKDEAVLLKNTFDLDRVYIEEILPAKMKYNLKSIREFSFIRDIITMVETALAVLG